jgi:thioester reductase-like protein
LLEIQKKILEFNGIKEAVVIVNGEENKYIAAYYVSEKEILDNVLKDYLQKYLPSYMIPLYFVKLDKMPLNQNGKIDKRSLPDISVRSNKVKLEAINRKQKELLNIYRKVLQNTEVYMNDNFFEVGGDSLNAVALVSNAILQKKRMTYSDIFKYPTPIEMYDYLMGKNIKESISNDIKNYDYTKINEIIENNRIEKLENYASNEIGNVLLTGVTGFLGAHILDNYLTNEKGNIYCIVRKKDGNDDVVDRVKNILNYYFDKKYDNEFGKRIFVVKGDITKVIDSEELALNVDTVINSAAHVKHFGNLELFNKINVVGTKNLIEFCINNNKNLIHISTLSVSGIQLEGGNLEQDNVLRNTNFRETELYINQNLDNVYAYTKFIAERCILESIANNGLKAKIIRVGNLTGRYIDGKFQPNFSENAFIDRLKGVLFIKAIPDNLKDSYFEFTPIDCTANAVIKLAKTDRRYNVFQVYNNRHLYLTEFIKIMKKLNIDIKIIPKGQIKKRLYKYLKMENINTIIKGIIMDLDKNTEINYESNVKITCDFTIEMLKINKFIWPEITEEYIIKFLSNLEMLGGIKND